MLLHPIHTFMPPMPLHLLHAGFYSNRVLYLQQALTFVALHRSDSFACSGVHSQHDLLMPHGDPAHAILHRIAPLWTPYFCMHHMSSGSRPGVHVPFIRSNEHYLEFGWNPSSLCCSTAGSIIQARQNMWKTRTRSADIPPLTNHPTIKPPNNNKANEPHRYESSSIWAFPFTDTFTTYSVHFDSFLQRTLWETLDLYILACSALLFRIPFPSFLSTILARPNIGDTVSTGQFCRRFGQDFIQA